MSSQQNCIITFSHQIKNTLYTNVCNVLIGVRYVIRHAVSGKQRQTSYNQLEPISMYNIMNNRESIHPDYFDSYTNHNDLSIALMSGVPI